MENCKPCQDVIPQFEGVKEHYKDNGAITFENWDLLEKAEECLKYDIQKTPTTLIFKDGVLSGKHEGPFIKKTIINKIQNL